MLDRYALQKVQTTLKSLPALLSLFSPELFGRSIFPRKLFNIMFYTTNRCNSHCQTCNIWQQQPKIDMSAEKIKEILDSKVISQFTAIGVEGGEFIIHPEYGNILRAMSGRNYGIMSNAIFVDRLVETVRKFKIKEVAVSLDGPPETYKKVRGVNTYNQVVEAITKLKEITNVGACFTFSPWNSVGDYNHVWTLCQKLGVRLLYNIYSDIEFFGAKRKNNLWEITKNPDGSPITNDYFLNYPRWVSGELKLPCLSIVTNVVIYPNGDVPLCQYRRVILGNVYERSLDEIWNDPRTVRLQREYRNCNKCWISYHRYWDLALVRNLDRLLPHTVVEKLVGSYQL